jgi:hypothetical protein
MINLNFITKEIKKVITYNRLIKIRRYYRHRRKKPQYIREPKKIIEDLNILVRKKNKLDSKKINDILKLINKSRLLLLQNGFAKFVKIFLIFMDNFNLTNNNYNTFLKFLKKYILIIIKKRTSYYYQFSEKQIENAEINGSIKVLINKIKEKKIKLSPKLLIHFTEIVKDVNYENTIFEIFNLTNLNNLEINYLIEIISHSEWLIYYWYFEKDTKMKKINLEILLEKINLESKKEIIMKNILQQYNYICKDDSEIFLSHTLYYQNDTYDFDLEIHRNELNSKELEKLAELERLVVDNNDIYYEKKQEYFVKYIDPEWKNHFNLRKIKILNSIIDFTYDKLYKFDINEIINTISTLYLRLLLCKFTCFDIFRNYEIYIEQDNFHDHENLLERYNNIINFEKKEIEKILKKINFKKNNISKHNINFENILNYLNSNYLKILILIIRSKKLLHIDYLDYLDNNIYDIVDEKYKIYANYLFKFKFTNNMNNMNVLLIQILLEYILNSTLNYFEIDKIEINSNEIFELNKKSFFKRDNEFTNYISINIFNKYFTFTATPEILSNSIINNSILITECFKQNILPSSEDIINIARFNLVNIMKIILDMKINVDSSIYENIYYDEDFAMIKLLWYNNIYMNINGLKKLLRMYPLHLVEKYIYNEFNLDLKQEIISNIKYIKLFNNDKDDKIVINKNNKNFTKDTLVFDTNVMNIIRENILTNKFKDIDIISCLSITDNFIRCYLYDCIELNIK